MIINRGKCVLAQITRDNFFYERTRAKMRCGLAPINKGQCVLAQMTRNNFFSIKGQGYVVCAGHKSQ
jgi:hypothetical protein